jgi:hypothetical protein
MDISKYRQELRVLFDDERELIETFLVIRGLVKGGIYKTKLKCGKKGCKCERGELHEVWMHYRSEGGKTKTRTIRKEEVQEYERYTRNYQRYRQSRAELIKLHKKQIRLIDLIEEGLRKENSGIEKKLFKKKR